MANVRVRLTPLVILVVFVASCADRPATTNEDAGSTVEVDGSQAEAELQTPKAFSVSDSGLDTVEAPTAEASSVPVTVSGNVVSAVDGTALYDAVVTAGDATVLTGSDGSFVLAEVQPGSLVTVKRPTWRSVSVELSLQADPLRIELEPAVVRALRVSRYGAADPDKFQRLLELADTTAVNALVFDTKDEAGTVLYDTGVAFADEIGAVDPAYDPKTLLAKANEHDLYTITRIVTFEDNIWSAAKADAKLGGAWVDPTDRSNWDYPLDLAVEACQLGFDEIQFDYVRFPAGRTGASVQDRIPGTSQERSNIIGEFLAEGRARLNPMGCGVSAAIFGIVMSSENDEGIGQALETVSASVDAVSPMLYPSHYSSGWLDFADPNEHPGPVIAHALDAGAGRMPPELSVRPWLQAFYYGAQEIQAQITEAESRGAGWILWNASGSYQQDWLPSD